MKTNHIHRTLALAALFLATVSSRQAKAASVIDPDGTLYSNVSDSSHFNATYPGSNLFNQNMTGVTVGTTLADIAEYATASAPDGYVAFWLDRNYGNITSIFYAQRQGGVPTADKVQEIDVWSRTNFPFFAGNPGTAPNATATVTSSAGAVWTEYTLSTPISGHYFLVKFHQNSLNGNPGGREFRLGVTPFLVLNTNDDGPGSLRATVASAPPGAVVNFAANLSGQTILLTTGTLSLLNDITIDGSSLASPVKISGNHTTSVVTLNGGVAYLQSLTIANGLNDYGGGVNQNAFGQYNGFVLNNCLLTGNTATQGGGGASGGTLTNCTLTGNTSLAIGGGAYGGDLFNCKLIGNTATVGGGGTAYGPSYNCTYVSNSALNGGGSFNTILHNCTLNNNTAATGGGIYGNQIYNCTLVGNTATNNGGGSASATLNNCTVVNNTASDQGGGSYSDTLLNCIIFSNSAPTGPNCFAVASSSYCSTTADTSGTGNISGAPLLAPFANYGGTTPTMPPLPGSPVIDAGSDTVTNNYNTDQRGYPRLAGAHVDIGAVEGLYVATGPGKLKAPSRLSDGSIRLNFTNFTGAIFPVVTATSLSLPASNWTQIGFTTETPTGSGQFQFTDPQATSNAPTRFYRVKSF